MGPAFAFFKNKIMDIDLKTDCFEVSTKELNPRCCSKLSQNIQPFTYTPKQENSNTVPDVSDY
jgi:hypothetical protein